MLNSTSFNNPPLQYQPGLPAADFAVAQLGLKTRYNPATGLVSVNQPLMNQVVAFKQAALPAMSRFVHGNHSPLAWYEGLLTLEAMKKAGVEGIDRLYGAVSKLNTTQNTLIEEALASFYGSLDSQCSFGPSVARLMAHATSHLPSNHPLDATEAWGHSVLDQLSKATAKETLKRLLPVFEANGWQVPASVSQGLRTSMNELGAFQELA